MDEQLNGGPEKLSDGAADHLIPGLRLPDMTLAATNADEMSLARLSGRAVVYCYTWTGRPDFCDPPHWDDIPGAHGSTPQTEAFRDLYPQLQELGVAVYGLSSQTSAYQREMVQRLRVPFAVLSDHRLAFAAALKLPTFATGGVTYLKRLTMIIDHGAIVKSFYPVTVPQDNAREVLLWLRQQQRD